MPTTEKTKGIILKISDTPGKDKLLHILTESGLFTAFITPKRSAGKKSYTFDLFTLGEFILYKTDSGNYLVNSITPQEYFYNLRNDIVKLSAAGYFASLVRHVASYGDIDYKLVFDIFIGSLKALANGADVKAIKPVYEIKMVQLLGFTPCLEADRKSSTYFFDPEDGRLYAEAVRGGIAIPRSVALSIYKIINSPADTLFDVCEADDKLYNTAQQYLLYHTEREFDTLRFLNGVI